MIGPSRTNWFLLRFLPRVVEPFGEAAFVKEGFFKLPELLVEKVIGLVD